MKKADLSIYILYTLFPSCTAEFPALRNFPYRGISFRGGERAGPGPKEKGARYLHSPSARLSLAAVDHTAGSQPLAGLSTHGQV